MEKTVRQILERPFEQNLIRTREGPGGIQLSYIEVQHYIDRLNEALGGDWSFELISREQVEDQVIVEGRLTAAGVVKTGLGGAGVTRRKDNGKLISLADDYKKAEADALKRCCRLLGIGGELYGGEVGGDEAEAPREERQQRAPAPAVRESAAVTGPGEGASTRVTQAQIGKLRHLVGSLGMDWAAFRSDVRQAQGVNLEFVSKRIASGIIDELLASSQKPRQPSSGNGRYA